MTGVPRSSGSALPGRAPQCLGDGPASSPPSRPPTPECIGKSQLAGEGPVRETRARREALVGGTRPAHPRWQQLRFDPSLQRVVVDPQRLGGTGNPRRAGHFTAAAHNGSGMRERTLRVRRQRSNRRWTPSSRAGRRVTSGTHGLSSTSSSARQPTIPRRSKRFTHACRKGTVNVPSFRGTRRPSSATMLRHAGNKRSAARIVSASPR